MSELTPLGLSALNAINTANLIRLSLQLVDDSKVKIKANSLSLHINSLKEMLPLYQATIKQLPDDIDSQKIAELDSYRDQDLLALFNSIRPFKNSRREAEKKAYLYLKQVFDNYSSVRKEAYSKQTFLVSKLLADLASSTSKTSIESLGIQKFITNIKESQAQFEQAYNNRQQVTTEKQETKAKELRLELITRYRHLCNATSNLAYLHQKGQMETPEALVLLKQLNIARKEIAEQVKRSKRSQKANSSKNQTETPEG